MCMENVDCDIIRKVRSLLGTDVETLEYGVSYRISTITRKNVRVNKVETSTPIYIPRQAFCNVKRDLSSKWIPIRPLKERWGTGYDGILKEYTPTMVSHVVAPILVKMGLCEVRKNNRHWEIRLVH